MKNTRKQKGITLVALIITIIVLLILAFVTIGVVQEGGIVEQVHNAKGYYDKQENDEKNKLAYLEKYLKKYTGHGKWIQEGNILTRIESDGTESAQVKIGDYVNYIEGNYTHKPVTSKGAGVGSTKGASHYYRYTLTDGEFTTDDLEWRVLGVNQDGELELISEKATSKSLYMANDTGYLNAKENLNTFCNDLYGKGTNAEGKNVAKNARSWNMEDINKLSGYTPQEKAKTIFRYPTQEEMDSYTGVPNSKIYMQSSTDGGKKWTDITEDRLKEFRLPSDPIKGGIGIANGSSAIYGTREISGLFYEYIVKDQIKTNTMFTTSEATEITNMLKLGTQQWIATTMDCAKGTYATFYICVTDWGDLSHASTFLSYENHYSQSKKVRPVVTISNDFTIDGSGSDAGTASNKWEIK